MFRFRVRSTRQDLFLCACCDTVRSHARRLYALSGHFQRVCTHSASARSAIAAGPDESQREILFHLIEEAMTLHSVCGVLKEIGLAGGAFVHMLSVAPVRRGKSSRHSCCASGALHRLVLPFSQRWSWANSAPAFGISIRRERRSLCHCVRVPLQTRYCGVLCGNKVAA